MESSELHRLGLAAAFGSSASTRAALLVGAPRAGPSSEHPYLFAQITSRYCCKSLLPAFADGGNLETHGCSAQAIHGFQSRFPSGLLRSASRHPKRCIACQTQFPLACSRMLCALESREGSHRPLPFDFQVIPDVQAAPVVPLQAAVLDLLGVHQYAGKRKFAATALRRAI